MEFDRNGCWRASWSPWNQGLGRPGQLCPQAPPGIWGGAAPSDLAVNVVSRGMKRARDRIQRALENYPRGFRRSEMWAENEIQI